MESQSWLINKGSRSIEICITEMHKWVIFEPLKPIQLPTKLALRYMDTYKGLCPCDNPEKYYTSDNPLKYLCVRDAGIGDLLLLEPVLRTMDKNNNVDITVLTRYPEVYENNPHIHETVHMSAKDNISCVDVESFDRYDDLRSYSETSPNRNKHHRTDIYNEKIAIKLNGKEPRLYFNEQELKKNLLNKKEGKTYIGLQCDASHDYRKYPYGKKLIDYLLKVNENFIIVLLGAEQYITKKHKRIQDYQAKTNIRQAINIINELDYMIACDSGLMHVALTLHVPTICLFSIITPDFRVRYYTGKREVLINNDLDCLGCGDKHMVSCRYGNMKSNPNFIAPCLKISPESIYAAIVKMGTDDIRKQNVSKKEDKPKINIIKSTVTLTMPIIVQNEEKNIPRFIELVMNNRYIGRTIAIDGGSTDKTVELLQKAGAEVYHHPYNSEYHDMQALQRNISCSYVMDDTPIIIMDLDECFSEELEKYLPVLANSSYEHALISRRTFKYYKDIDDPTRQIKDYPDYQPRFYHWHRRFKFVGSPHHHTWNVAMPVKINKDIIHFECENKDREALEKKWSKMWSKTKEVYA